MNHRGYCSKFHKLRADGLDDSLAVLGRPALENIAWSYRLRAASRADPREADDNRGYEEENLHRAYSG
jgi:hypothetical protein